MRAKWPVRLRSDSRSRADRLLMNFSLTNGPKGYTSAPGLLELNVWPGSYHQCDCPTACRRGFGGSRDRLVPHSEKRYIWAPCISALRFSFFWQDFA
jgi:hypothetical protein